MAAGSESAAEVAGVDVWQDFYGSTHIRPNETADQADVTSAVRSALEKGSAVFVYMDLIDTTGLGSVLKSFKDVTWKPYIQTSAYNIVFVDPTGKVPEACTAIEGAHGAIVSSDGKRVYLARKEMYDRRTKTMVPKWTFVGGAVDARERPDEAFERELCQELGLTPDALASFRRGELVCIGGSVKPDAREYGRGENVESRFISDHVSFFALPVDVGEFDAALKEGTGGDGELDGGAWFELGDDGSPRDAQGAVPPMLWSNEQALKRYNGSNMTVDVQDDGSAFYWQALPADEL